MMSHINLKYEMSLWDKGYTVIGVDEVGRGAFSGPVYVCAYSMKKIIDPRIIKEAESLGVNDSKLVSARKRILLDPIIKKYGDYAIGTSSTSVINNIGIVKATQLAARQAIARLMNSVKTNTWYIFSDAFLIPGFRFQKAIIHGDRLVFSIAAASIIAKVARDKHMVKLSSLFPHYAWDRNKGYGTGKHINALKKYGPCSHHRKLFIRNFIPLCFSSLFYR